MATRRLVERRVDELLAREHPENFALVFMDVDNFKNVNDYYGHSVGDPLLKQFAQRIGFHLAVPICSADQRRRVPAAA